MTHPLINSENPSAKWHEALSYFKKRGSVLFLSDERFWSPYPYVHQSLARLLVKNGVSVTWLDGSGWRKENPVVKNQDPRLKVGQLYELPGRRFSPIQKASDYWRAQQIKSLITKKRPVVWIQGALDEFICRELPYIDAISTFDDPYRYQSGLESLKKAKVVLCQNQFTFERLSPLAPEKTFLSLPPIEFDRTLFPESPKAEFPKKFPKKVMGYIGSFRSQDFDLILLETLIRNLPDWGFLVVGRTDLAGEKKVDELSRYSNFLRVPWVDRNHLTGYWKAIQATLLLYRPDRTQDGAFPVKVVESTAFGVSCVATEVPKTLDLASYFPRTSVVDHFIAEAVKVATSQPDTSQAFSYFSSVTHPTNPLIQVANFLAKT
jgi:glycosyltransferase involved in cell wall biosynthesis